MEYETLEFKLKTLEEKIDKVCESLERLNMMENERLEKYAESNTKLCYLEKNVDDLKSDLKALEIKVKEYSEKNFDKFKNWVSLIITIFLFLITIITLISKGVKYDEEDAKNVQQIEISETVAYNIDDYNFEY